MNMDLTKLPDNLPHPMDDKSCDHLLGMTIQSTVLPSTKKILLIFVRLTLIL